MVNDLGMSNVPLSSFFIELNGRYDVIKGTDAFAMREVRPDIKTKTAGFFQKMEVRPRAAA